MYYGNQQQLEYDFTVAPGADPGVIRLAFSGAESMALDAQGDLVLHTAAGDVEEHAPVLYQEKGGARQAVSGHYVLEPGGQVGFAVGNYDSSQPLVIDPTLGYSTFLGGDGNDQGNAIAVDQAGNVYITGYTDSDNFPETGDGVPGNLGSQNIFVSKLNAAGTALVYSTYLGADGSSQANGIAVDSSGDAYITGSTDSDNFPTTAGAFQTEVVSATPSWRSSIPPDRRWSTPPTWTAVTMAPLKATRSPWTPPATPTSRVPPLPQLPDHLRRLPAREQWQQCLRDQAQRRRFGPGLFHLPRRQQLLRKRSGNGIAVDASGDAYVTGSTESTNFPTTAGAFQTDPGGFTAMPS